jgi:phosphoadenosine phosphosulfate reductase
MVLDRMVEKMNMPTRRGAWCCDEYKDCCKGSSCELSVKCLGVRISESAKRAGAWKSFTVTKRGDSVVAPVAYWTDADIWQVIRENNIPYCKLYDQGWSRIGCVGCPKNPKSQAREFELMPEFKAMWKEGALRCWERGQKVLNRSGERYFVSKFSSPDALFEWWTSGVNENAETNCVFEEMMENV